MTNPSINFDAILRPLLNSASVVINPAFEPLFFAHIERLSLSEYLNLDTMFRSSVEDTINPHAPNNFAFELKPEFVEKYKNADQYPELAKYIQPTSSMSKEELFTYLSEQDMFTSETIPSVYDCVGKVEDVFSDELSEQEKEHNYRAYLWRNPQGDSFITWDLGNHWSAFMCEGTPEALREYKSETIKY